MMIISWNVTGKCNLSCQHCCNKAGEKADELSTEEGRELIEEIARAGFKGIAFGGGEALLRKDIFDLVSFASDFGMRTVLGTNGLLLDTEAIRRLKDCGLARAAISLDSAESGPHDHLRGKEGAWGRSVEAMKACASEGLEFQVHSRVTKFNYEGIESLTDFAGAHGARAHHVFFLVAAGNGKGAKDLVLSKGEYNSLLGRLLIKQKDCPIELKPMCAPQFALLAEAMKINPRPARGCAAGIDHCCIFSNGDVFPCPYLPLRLGNIRKSSFSVLWRENVVLQRLRGQGYKGSCGICGNKYSCGGCRARAFHMYGDFMGEDPCCFLKGRQNESALADASRS